MFLVISLLLPNSTFLKKFHFFPSWSWRELPSLVQQQNEMKCSLAPCNGSWMVFGHESSISSFFGPYFPPSWAEPSNQKEEFLQSRRNSAKERVPILRIWSPFVSDSRISPLCHSRRNKWTQVKEESYWGISFTLRSYQPPQNADIQYFVKSNCWNVLITSNL